MSEKSGGRPTLYKPEYCEQLIQHMANGLSYEAFAGAIGVSKQTLYDWEKANDQFLDAKNKGVEMARLFWEQKGLDGLFSETFEDKDAKTRSSKSINATIWLFNMKNRFGWRDRQPDEHDTVINNTNSVSTKSDAEIDAKIQELLAKAGVQRQEPE